MIVLRFWIGSLSLFPVRNRRSLSLSLPRARARFILCRCVLLSMHPEDTVLVWATTPVCGRVPVAWGSCIDWLQRTYLESLGTANDTPNSYPHELDKDNIPKSWNPCPPWCVRISKSWCWIKASGWAGSGLKLECPAMLRKCARYARSYLPSRTYRICGWES